MALPDGIDWAEKPFRRGLPGAIVADDGGAFVANADDLFMRFPVESLELRVVRMSEVRELAECSWLERIISLVFTQGTSARSCSAYTGITAPHEPDGTALGSEFTTPATVSTVVRSRVFRQLTSLSVRIAAPVARWQRNSHNSPNRPRRRNSDLSSNRLTAEVVSRLVSSRAVNAVEDLDLSENNLGAEGVTAAGSRKLPGVAVASLAALRPQEEGVSALAAAEFFPELRSLSLGSNNLQPGGGVRPWRTPRRITSAYSICVRTASATVARRHWRNNPRLGNLILLDLADAKISNAGAGSTRGLAAPRRPELLEPLRQLHQRARRGSTSRAFRP